MNSMLLAFGDTSCDWIAVTHRDIGGTRHIVVAVVLPHGTARSGAATEQLHSINFIFFPVVHDKFMTTIAPALTLKTANLTMPPRMWDEDKDEYDHDSEEYNQVIQVRVEDEDWEVAEKAYAMQTSRNNTAV
ncbi:hypothetical protein ARMGADRAFT_1025641 [Armillaria gallica]|uniref:Uncharacterized protein n=1 Tax=Armillaria gallica TaxID=47427 RepID=A0A2H3E6U3_ARMGA|nr:hypothetical protein ARMGADRAFT_1025641 [Armillaria gallica]